MMLLFNYKQLKKISYVLTSHELTTFNQENFTLVFSLNDTLVVKESDIMNQLFDMCQHWGLIRTGHTIDFEVSIPCQIFLKTKKETLINKLSLIECLFQSNLRYNQRSIFTVLFKEMLEQNLHVHDFNLKLGQFIDSNDSITLKLVQESLLNILIEAKIIRIAQRIITVDEDLLVSLRAMIEQYQLEEHLVVSTTLNILQFDVFAKIFGYKKYINHLEIDYTALEQYYNKHLVLEFRELKMTPNNGRRHSEIQDIFRNSLLVEFEYKCAICQITGKQELIASHIIPVRDTDNLMMSGDYHNGLLLCHNHDRLFDQGMISFNLHGHILISPLIEPESYSKLLIDPSIRLDKRYLLHSRVNFLKYHLDKIFRKEE